MVKPLTCNLFASCGRAEAVELQAGDGSRRDSGRSRLPGPTLWGARTLSWSDLRRGRKDRVCLSRCSKHGFSAAGQSCNALLRPCRKHWQEQSGKLGNRFDLEAAVGSRGTDHHMLLDRAKDLYDAGKQKGGADPEQTAKRQSADGQGL